MVAERDLVQHRCKELREAPFTVEDRGEGWFLYVGTDRGPNPVNFCPCCGLSLHLLNYLYHLKQWARERPDPKLSARGIGKRAAAALRALEKANKGKDAERTGVSAATLNRPIIK